MEDEKKSENPLTINSVYAGLSFGFFLKLWKEKPKTLGTRKRRVLEQTLQAPDATNAAPCWATGTSSRGTRQAPAPVRNSPLGDEVHKLW